MRLADKDTNPGAYAVRVKCLRCHSTRQLAHMRADLDGPPFFAYFCDPHCVPVTSVDAEQVYYLAGWQRIGRRENGVDVITWKRS